MPRFSGKVDFTDLEKLQEKFDRITNNQADEINEELVKTKAALFLRNVIPITPVGVYNTGQVGGTLRRGWTVKSEREAELGSTFGGSTNIQKHVDEDLKPKKRGKDYTVEIVNPVSYASYVNYGHRTRSGGYVNGQFFLEKALSQTDVNASKVLNRKLNTLLRRALDGN